MTESNYVLNERITASSGKRFLNYVVDYAATYILAYLFGIAMPFVINILDSFGFTAPGFWYFNLNSFYVFLIGIMLTLLYYFVIEAFCGRSLGKFVTGTIVVDENGLMPKPKKILIRTLCRLIPFEAFTFFNSSRGWHDSISDTYVVNKKELDEEVKLFEDFNLIGQKEVV
ncbi:RDD family protein [Flavobacterium hungaricum]|uniref:RDD family protein n=1 Tax=Flavobacterium hungaricum TaxID=2082725 RepID=A0ABR9TJ15_9FLAO|nr:RDD family protein [Flavobacterium hungaricum]MBE8725353.1 RDD family protein [Flavobacterium hungaricum]